SGERQHDDTIQGTGSRLWLADTRYQRGLPPSEAVVRRGGLPDGGSPVAVTDHTAGTTPRDRCGHTAGPGNPRLDHGGLDAAWPAAGAALCGLSADDRRGRARPAGPRTRHLQALSTGRSVAPDRLWTGD